MNIAPSLFALTICIFALLVPPLMVWLWHSYRTTADRGRSLRLQVAMAILAVSGLLLLTRLASLDRAELALQPTSAWVTLTLWTVTFGTSAVTWSLATRKHVNAGIGSLLTNVVVVLLWSNLAEFGYLPSLTAPPTGPLGWWLMIGPPLFLASRGMPWK